MTMATGGPPKPKTVWINMEAFLTEAGATENTSPSSRCKREFPLNHDPAKCVWRLPSVIYVYFPLAGMLGNYPKIKGELSWEGQFSKMLHTKFSFSRCNIRTAFCKLKWMWNNYNGREVLYTVCVWSGSLLYCPLEKEWDGLSKRGALDMRVCGSD